MMLLWRVKTVVLCLAALVATHDLAGAQDFRGRINGTVTDNSGAVLPGVTVSVTSPALIQQQTQVTGAEGDYRFIALPPGVYEVLFELPGFQTVKREGVRVVINQTLSVDQQLQVATLQETVTVTGESPVVDTSTNTVGTNFTKELLTEIPNARDIWAAMAQAPGLQMTSYDVGGSRTGTQTGFLAYGFGDQATTKLEGINTTEGTSGNAGYFDFGSFEEFQVGGAGNDASADVGGAYLNITVKSGGDKFQGSWYSDWEGDSTISDNVPDAFKTPGQRDEDGFFFRNASNPNEGMTRGNPIDRQYDINANLGGPIYKKKAWFFYSYRLNDQYKAILGSDQLARSKLSNQYSLKGTFQLSQNNQIIAYANKREKLQDLRGFGPLTPASAAQYQSSRNYPSKIQWTSVLGGRAFLDVLAGQWYNFFPLEPTWQYGLFPEDQVVPGRIDTANNQYFNGGGNDTYQDRKRFKPQFTASLAYFKDGWKGSHDFKFGYEWKRDRRKEGRSQPFDIFYRDLNGQPNELELYNSPVTGITDTLNHSAYISDTWKWNRRLTLNVGLRMEYYADGWPEQSFAPNGHAVLANWNDQRYREFVAPRTVSETTVASSTTFAPRLGVAYDLTGNNRTVLKGYFGRFYWNSTDVLAVPANPVGLARLRYQFLDQNGNGILDGPQELGAFRSTQGGSGSVRIDPDIARPYTQEFSGHLEHEIKSGLSGRVSYVYKNTPNEWDEVDLGRINAYTIPVSFNDIGPDGVRGTGDDRTVQLSDRPTDAPQDRAFTNPEDPSYESAFQTIEVALNRRMSGRWMALTSFGYTWMNQFHNVTSSTDALSAAGNGKEYNWQPNQRLFGDQGRETSTNWNFKFIGRYTLPLAIGLSGSYKVQSGRQWGRVTAVPLVGAGQENIRMEPVTANRSPAVDILDVRVDKAFNLGFGKLTAMVDVFNLTNLGTVTNFRTTTGTSFQEVIAILDPRIIRFGVRFDF